MPETISLAILQTAVDNLRRRAAGLSPIERCKLRCLEENLRIIKDHQVVERADLLFVRFRAAALTMRANADVAGVIADAMWMSNRVASADCRAAIQRSRLLIDHGHT